MSGRATGPQVSDRTVPQTDAATSKPTTSAKPEHASNRTAPQSQGGGQKQTAPQTTPQKRGGSYRVNNFSKEELTEFKETFHIFAKEEKIEIAEVDTAMRMMQIHPSAKQVEYVARDLDINRDGKIDFQDFLVLLSSVMQEKDIDETVEAFRVFDKDGNGMLRANELKHIMSKYVETMTEKDIDELIEVADIDADGFINYEELARKMSAN